MNKVQNLYSSAYSLWEQRNLIAALNQCDAILQEFPQQFDTLVLKCILLSDINRPIDALMYANQALAIKKDAVVYNNLGNIYQTIKQYELAMDNYDAAIALKPSFLQAYYNKANCYRALNQHENAIKWYEKTVKIDPKYYFAYCNMSLCYQALQKFEESLDACNKALAINPDHYGSLNNKGFTLHVLMRLDESIAAFQRAMEVDPNANDSKFNIGFVYLLKGDLEKGWKGHENRWNNKYKPTNLPRVWNKEDLEGKTIYIFHEQGLGDTIQFVRYAKQLKKMGAKVVAGVKPEIIELFKSMPYLDEVVDIAKTPKYDYCYPMMSLPYVFNTRVHNVPYEPYLSANPSRVQYFAEKMGKHTKPRVGVVWSGGFRADQPEIWGVNERRNIPMEKFAGIYNSDVEFYNLQFGAKEYPFPMVDLMGEVKDFSDTAAIIQNLDCVITVDTSTAHVAGAMGKKVWLLNRFDTCWRWLESGNSTEWYPSFKIYRQNKFMNWDNVIDEVKRDLNEL